MAMSYLLKNIMTKSRVGNVCCMCTKTGKIMTVTEAHDHITEMLGTRKQWGSDEITAGSGGVMQHIATDQSELPRRKPQDSYTRVVIPLSQPESRDKYLFYNKGIRFGRLLEDFDTLAVFICYNHNKNPDLGENQKSPYAFVTALVDRIEYSSSSPQLSPYKDIFLSGKVTWVGRSSMECTMLLEQEIGEVMQKVITARFLFVARNPLTNTAAIVNPLDPQTPEEKEVFRLGEETKVKRQLEGDKSLLKTVPTEEERLIIHELFLSTIDHKAGTFKVRVKPENTAWMSDSMVKSLVICHPQNRNMYNKIFGGFLMMKAYEIAWTNACLYTKVRPVTCKCVDDIIFKKPVEIGSLLFLSSQVVYTNGPDIQIHVHAEVCDPESGIRETTNNFHFTFHTGGQPHPPRVIPNTYAEAMLYLVGKRHYES